MEINSEDNIRQFEAIFSLIKRSGSEELLNWIRNSDFYSAPASTRFHGAYEGGLLQHTLNVYYALLGEVKSVGLEVSSETLAIVALLHDICKVEFYRMDVRNVKNSNGQWVAVPYYTIEEKDPRGYHADKSVSIIKDFMKLTREEEYAIRAHMGGFDESVKGGAKEISTIFNICKLAVLLHLSDMKATFIMDA